MKKIVVLVILLFSTTVMAQNPDPGWTTLRETSITVANGSTNYPYDIFTNGEGNHIIVQEPNALKYYKMKVDGTTLTSTSLETNVSVISPSISGDLTRLYVVYRKSNENFIRTKVSTNGGVSWSSLSTYPPNSNASSIECEFSKDNLHVIYLIGTDVFHSYYNTVVGGWVLTQQIYDDSYTPANPRIAINNAGSVDTVYFTFDKFETHRIKWRRYIVGGSLQALNRMWNTSTYYSINLGLAVDNNYMYYFYKPNVPLYIQGRIQRIWNNDFITTILSNNNTHVNKNFTTRTANNKPYSASWSTLETFPNRIVRMGFNGATTPPSVEYDVIHTQNGLTPVNVVNLSSAGNDIHVVWKDNLGTNNGNNLRYKYYDDIPLPPQNLTVTKSANNHPLLSWINPNPDVSLYKIYRRNACIGDWETDPINSTNNLYYEDLTQSYCTAIPPQQCTYLCNFEYRVTAVDPGPKESGYSNTVSAWLVGGPPQKAGIDEPVVETVFEYSLGQNYPNPFNPTTTINYSIKSAGDVSLKVYDMLGTEVASLVNEMKEAGNYSVNFNAANLSSGLYVYILSTNNFMDTKKLILLK
jgi:hypothetical protein